MSYTDFAPVDDQPIGWLRDAKGNPILTSPILVLARPIIVPIRQGFDASKWRVG